MNIELLDHQWEALDSLDKFKEVLLLGGVGSGKSFTGSPWVLKKYNESPKSLGLITANTYGQLQKATLASLFSNLYKWKVPFSYNQNKSMLTINEKKKFLCLGLDSYDQHRGIEVGEWWGDEVAYNSKESIQVMRGRLRDKGGKLDVMFTTTPKGFNWLYDDFGTAEKKGKRKVIRARSSENIYLPNGYLESLMEDYDEKMVSQELDGEFVNITQGRIYYSFNRDLHIQDTNYKGQPIWIGNDFNVNPMTAVACYVEGNKIVIFDEFYLEDSNTYELADAIYKKYKNRVRIVPDSTGIKRSSSARKNTTDFSILKETFGSDRVIYSKNPHRLDRYNCVNGLFKNGRIIISPKCKKLIRDLEQVCYKEGSDNPDTTQKDLTHISDSLGYIAWKLFPLRKPTSDLVIEHY